MTCATCARRVPPSSPASAGRARPTRWTRCASPARCRPTRTCRWRSNGQPGDAGPDETHELLGLWHNQRRSLVKSRQQLLNEADALLHELPEEIRADLPDDPPSAPG